MSEKLKIQLMELTTYIFLIFCIFSLYKFYTRPVSLNNAINTDSIHSICVNLIFNELPDYEIPNEQSFILSKEEDIHGFLKILDKYEYSKIPKFYNNGTALVNYSGGIIDCTINYDDKKILQKVSVNSNKEVSFYNKKGKYHDYVIKGNEEKLFEELLSWINERY